MNIVTLIDETYHNHGDHERLSHNGVVWTLARMLGAADALSASLLARGVRRGDRVAVILPVCPTYHAALPAIWRIGATAVPVHDTLAPEELNRVLAVAAVKAVITTDELAKALSPELSGAILTVGDAEDAPRRAEPIETVDCAPSDPAVIVFTSGSTGKPKGVIQTHGNFLSLVHDVNRSVGFEQVFPSSFFDDVIELGFVSYAHTVGPQRIVLAYGHRVKTVLLDRLEVVSVLEAIQRERITCFNGTPAVYAMLCGFPEIARYDLSSVTTWRTSAAPITEESLQRYERIVGKRIYQIYGLSETLAAVIAEPAAVPRRPGSTGRPLAGAELKLIRDDGTTIERANEVGELCIARGSNAAGYLNAPEQDAATFRGRWLHTGDLAQFDSDGFVYLMGQTRQVINQGGYKIYPQEVVSVIEALPAVERAVVTAIPDPVFGSVVGAFIKRTPGASLTEDEVLSHCRRSLGEAKTPRHLRFVASFPLNASMKVDTARLVADAARAAPGDEVPAQRDAKHASAQQSFADLVRTVLVELLGKQAHEIPADQPLMDLGMTSLKAVELSTRLSRALGGRPIASTLIFNHPTLAAIVAFIADEGPAPARPRPSDAAPGLRPEPLAIVGMSCRFPGGVESAEQLWELLARGADAITDVPMARFDMNALYDPKPYTRGRSVTRRGGFVGNHDRFDAAFFGISDLHAAGLDPAHRLALELAWEAVEDAGHDPHGLRGSATGVWVGFSTPLEYAALKIRAQLGGADDLAVGGFGTSPAMIAGRISYVLGLQGPSMVIDTACSSSLVALHLACQSLRRGEIHQALVGAAQLILTPSGFITLSNVGALSPTGVCRAFDAQADGYVRAEGGAMLLLKRLSDAQRDGDRIVALIRGSAVNHDGRSSSLTAPNGMAQEQVIREALADAETLPASITYVEAHGTGTQLGDPVEAHALISALAHGRDATRPLRVGSIKTNIGHTEAAAGVAGVMKVALALNHRWIPPTLHFDTLNKHIQPGEFQFEIVTRGTALPAVGDVPAGVSSFGISGTNAHVVLDAAPPPAAAAAPFSGPSVLLLSARTSGSLAALEHAYADYLAKNPSVDIGSLCATAYRGRAHFDYRTAAVGDTATALRDRLAGGGGGGGPIRGRRPAQLQKAAFVFVDGGIVEVGQRAALERRYHVFTAALRECASAVGHCLGSPVADVLAVDSALLPPQVAAHVAEGALSYALARLWLSIGIVPDAVVGDGMAEVVAALVAGLIDVGSAFRILTTHAPLQATGARVRLNLSADLVVHQPRFPLLSTNAEAWIQSAEGWRAAHQEGEIDTSRVANGGVSKTPLRKDAARLPAIESGLRVLTERGYDLFVEVTPGAMAPGGAETAAEGRTWIASPRSARNASEEVLQGVGRWYASGRSVDWSGIDAVARPRCPLPTYRFERSHYWIDEPKAWKGASGVATHGAEQERSAQPGSTTAIADAVQNVATLTAALERTARAVLGQQAPDGPIHDTPLADLGMDSLLAMDFRDAADKELAAGVELPADLFLKNLSIAALAAELARVLVAARPSPPARGVSEETASASIVRLRTTPSDRARLLCFHHAGGAPHQFSLWFPELPAGVGLYAAQLAKGAHEALPGTADALRRAAQAIAAALDPTDRTPLVLVGHSLGAYLAYEVARILRESTHAPRHALVVSGAASPAFGQQTFARSLAALEPAQFAVRVHELGFLEGANERPALVAVALQTMRDHFQLLATYVPVTDQALTCAVHAVAMENDDLVAKARVQEWSRVTTGAFVFSQTSGPHVPKEAARRALLSQALGALSTLEQRPRS